MNREYRKAILEWGILFLFVIYYILTCYPALMFKHQYQHKKYKIYSDHDMPASIEIILDSVNTRLEQSELYTSSMHNIAFCNNRVMYVFLTNIAYSSFGNTNLFSNFITLARVSIDDNLIYSMAEVNNERALSSVLIRELTHTFINEYWGRVSYYIMLKWKMEGYCEYMAQNSSYDIENGFYNLVNNIDDDSMSFKYFKYCLLVTYLMDHKNKSFVQIVNEDIDPNDLEKEIVLKLRNAELGNIFN